VNKDTQVKKIIRFMQKHGSITTMQAFGIGVTRLASRIFDIRRMGIEIESEMVSVKNREGETCRVARYKIA